MDVEGLVEVEIKVEVAIQRTKQDRTLYYAGYHTTIYYAAPNYTQALSLSHTHTHTHTPV